jgi:superfamily I DNA/RNA helicase/RecB family exonuclease
MEWTPAQRQVLEHRSGWLQVQGPAGSGRTSALIERWRRRPGHRAPTRPTLVVCRSRDAADRFGRSALDEQAWAADALAFTTCHRVALDLVRRHRGDKRLLTRVEQWNLVRRMLADDDPSRWPSCPEFVARAAFVDEVAGAVLAIETAGCSDDGVRAVAGRWGEGPRWEDLLAFRRRYRARTSSLAVVDAAQLFTEAITVLADDDLAAAEAARWPEILVDDADLLTAPMGAVIDRLALASSTGPGSGCLVAAGGDGWAARDAGPDPDGRGARGGSAGGDSRSAAGTRPAGGPGWSRWRDPSAWAATVTLDYRFRPALVPTTIGCRHPSSEPEAIARVLLDAHDEGVAWADMAVLVRSVRRRAPGISRALTRHGIPVRVTPGSSLAEPAVQAIIDFFAWAKGDRSAFDRLLVSPAVDLAPRDLRRLRRQAAGTDPTKLDHPRVARLLALRDTMASRLTSADPAALMFQAWPVLLATLVPDPDRLGTGAGRADTQGARALEAVAAFLAGVSERAAHDRSWRIADELALVEGPEFEPDPWRAPIRPADDDVVTVDAIWSATGRSWDTVVVAGCLEGELPRVADTARFFDHAIPAHGARNGPVGKSFSVAARIHPGVDAEPLRTAMAIPPGSPDDQPPTLGERRAASLAEERQLWAAATSRARRQLVATAAPAPGQIVSRFLAGAPIEAPRLARVGESATAAWLPPASDTVGTAPVYAEPRLDLSATRLTTYDDCPLRYFYQYVLGVRGPGGVAASMGTLVHAVLASFLDPGRGAPVPGDAVTGPPPDTRPAGAVDRSWATLEALAESMWSGAGWSESIAPYQPMREQARRDVFTMLQDWWEAEASRAEAAGAWPDVAAVEYPFDIAVGGHRVRGSIDRIDRVPGGIAIIDYKTGSKVPGPQEVADDLQLATYHLAAVRDGELAALGPPVSLQLSYLRTGVSVSQPITEDHAARTQQRIVETAGRILAEEFDPSVEAECEYCDFWRLCPLQTQGRQVGRD